MKKTLALMLCLALLMSCALAVAEESTPVEEWVGETEFVLEATEVETEVASEAETELALEATEAETVEAEAVYEASGDMLTPPDESSMSSDMPTPPDGSSTPPEAPDGSASDSNAPDGNTHNDSASDGNATDGNMPNGNNGSASAPEKPPEATDGNGQTSGTSDGGDRASGTSASGDQIASASDSTAQTDDTSDSAVTTLTISKSTTKKVYFGNTYQIAVKGRTIKACKSSKAKVASVTDDGVITARKAGKAKIGIVTTDGKKLVLTLKVLDPAVATKIAITNGSKATLAKGKTLQLEYALKPATATSGVKWKSSKKSVAKVSSDGVVTARKVGKAKITATTSNGKKASITIKVTKATANTDTADATDTADTTDTPGAPTTTDTSGGSAATLTGDSTGQSYASATGGENAVLVSGSTVKLDTAYVTKTGDSSGEDADFYGTNAAILAKGGATLTIDSSEITTSGSHANAVFSYGSGTTVNVSNSTITTTGNNSGGIMTTGGGTMNATDLTVSTAGNSAAAIRSDRGGGTVNVTGGKYTASGVGSPAIYSTAAITVSNATLSATASEAVVIEGGNSVTLKNVDITGDNNTLNGQSTVKTNVLIYQSMSGDASNGASTFTMTGGTMTARSGVMFHVTNVTTTINLSGVRFTNASDTFLTATADAWGKSGKNGGKVTLNLNGQSVTGDIKVDSASSLAMNLENGSSYTGTISNEGNCAVSLFSDSTWTLTGDSYVTSLSGSTGNIVRNGYALYVNGLAIE